MVLKHLLSGLVLFLFLLFFYFSKDKKKGYVIFVLCSFPFLDLNLTNERFGGISVFDAFSYFVLFYFIKDFIISVSLHSIYILLFCGLCGVLFVGAITSEFWSYALVNCLKFLSVFIYAKIFIDVCVVDVGFVSYAIKYLKVVCITSLVFVFFQLLFGLSFTFYPELNINSSTLGELRYPSFFFDPQIYAQYLAMICFIFLIDDQATLIKVGFDRVMFLALVFTLFVTGGRAGLLGLCCGLFVAFIAAEARIKLYVLFLLVTCYFSLSTFSNSFTVFNRKEDLTESFQIRSQIWNEAYSVFVAHPFLGVGIGEYRNFALRHSESGYYIIDDELVYYGTESGYLKILAECGLLGFIIIFSVIIIPLFSSVKGVISKALNSNVLLLIASIVAWATAFVTSNTLDDKRIVVLLGTIISLMVASLKLTKLAHAKSDHI